MLAIMKRSASTSLQRGNKPKQQKLFGSNTTKFADLKWHSHGELVKGNPPLLYLDGASAKPSTKIASFDLDWTLIATKSGKNFPKDVNDWKFLNSKVTPRLKALHNDGFKIVLFSNQGGIEKKKTTVEEVQTKLMDILQSAGVPFQAFVSTGENIFRKPCVEMWKFCVERCNGDTKVDLGESFYVGDAAGRPKNWVKGRKKDFSCSDRKFAHNVGVTFHTPEEFFESAPVYTHFEWGSLDPAAVPINNEESDPYKHLVSQATEMLIMVGMPASGKSTFASRHLKTYTRVNRDTLKTIEKCRQVAADALTRQNSVVIDNTNPTREARALFIATAKKLNIPVRCLHFQTARELCAHLNMYRQAQSGGKQRRVPDVGFNMFKSRYEEPKVDEGFTEIVEIYFKATFDNEEDEKSFKLWT